MAGKGKLSFRFLWWLLKQWKAWLLIGLSLYIGFSTGRCVYEQPFRSSPRAVSSGLLPSSRKQPVVHKKQTRRSFSTSNGALRFSNRILRRLRVRTTRVKRRLIRRNLLLKGKVEWATQSRQVVRVPVGGTLDQWFVQRPGLKVQASEKLCSIVPPGFVKLQQQWLKLHSEKPAILDLTARQNWTSRESTLRKQLLALGLEAGQLDSLQKYKRPFRRLFVKAPLRSRVLQRHWKAGTSVQQGTPLVTLGDLTVLQVRFAIPVQWSAAFQTGNTLVWQSPAHPGRTFSSRLQTRALAVSSTFGMTALVQNPKEELRPGMKMQGSLSVMVNAKGAPVVSQKALKKEEQPLVIPREALLWEGGQAFVFLRQVHKTRHTVRYLRRKVKVGSVIGNWRMVLAGVGEGEEIVSRGVAFLAAEFRLRQTQLWGSP